MRVENKICKEKFIINNVVIGDKGDVLEIVDAMPFVGETEEDVAGYCDVFNNTKVTCTATTWLEVDENSIALEDII